MTRPSSLASDVWRALGQGLGAEDVAAIHGHPLHEVRREIAQLRERRMIRAALNLARQK